MKALLISIFLVLTVAYRGHAYSINTASDSIAFEPIEVPKMPYSNIDSANAIELYNSLQPGYSTQKLLEELNPKKIEPVTIYALPYSLTTESRDWHRLWINTGVMAGAYISALLVLECLPEDATTWNRAELQQTPPLKRWFQNIFKKGPEWDHDNIIFNYVLHPYAGAAYFMGARSCGFNFYRSWLYSALISTIGWEFGIEACMERPSYQDLVITPCVGCLIGEGFYRIKRIIVDNGYELAGSRFLGGFVAFLVDPLNEFVGLFAGNPARKYAAQLRMEWRPSSLSIIATF